MMVEDLALFLQAQGHGVLAVDLFTHVAPQSPDLLTVLLEEQGARPEWVQDNNLVEIENAHFQLSTRGMTADAARNRIEAPYQMLMGIRNEVINGTRYVSVRPVDAPAMIGRDENSRYIAVCNFLVQKELSSPV